MKSFSELIKQRRSMRKFTDEELTQEEVVTLLKAALMSPSSKRSNCWQFIAVDDKETLDKLSRCKEMGSSFLKEASLAIVVLADPLASDVWIEDASIRLSDDSATSRRSGTGKLLDTSTRTIHRYRHVFGRVCARHSRHTSSVTGFVHRSHRPQRYGA